MIRRVALGVCLLSVGCTAPPPCPPSLAPTHPVPELPTCIVDDAPEPGVEDLKLLVEELRQLRASLALLPSERTVLGPGTAGALVVLRTMLTQTRALDADPAAAVPQDLPMLAALWRAREQVAIELQEARAHGWGDRHPLVRELMAAVELVELRAAMQRQTERAELSKLESVLASAKPSRAPDDSRAVLQALRDRYSSADFTLARVASFDPMALRLLAFESARLLAETARLSRTYGPNHPRMIAIQARRAELDDRFGQELRLLKSSLEVATRDPLDRGLPALPDSDVRPERARQVADEIALLSIRLADARTRQSARPIPSPRPCVMRP